MRTFVWGCAFVTGKIRMTRTEREEIVRQAGIKCMETGILLLHLHNEKAFKNRGFRNHGEYVESLGFSRSQASQLEKAAKLLLAMSEMAEEGEVLPEEEAQLRPLCRLVTASIGEIGKEQVEGALTVWRETVEASEISVSQPKKEVRVQKGQKQGKNCSGGVQKVSLERQKHMQTPPWVHTSKPKYLKASCKVISEAASQEPRIVYLETLPAEPEEAQDV